MSFLLFFKLRNAISGVFEAVFAKVEWNAFCLREQYHHPPHPHSPSVLLWNIFPQLAGSNYRCCEYKQLFTTVIISSNEQLLVY